jgi:3'-phosphoadenosine 5'-phosphosulfate sulfotransferase (PAPS reductase)/FAD synthetase
MAMRDIDFSLLDKHQRIALQFSGGKDSLAVAFLLKPYWDRVVFYHTDSGDLLPEVREIVEAIASEVPNFRRIPGDVAAWQERYGLPSDLVPTSSTPMGRMAGFGKVSIQDRFTCCACNIMQPLHDAMRADQITLAIRGTKRSDMRRLPHEGGDTALGYHLWLPLIEWSDADVFAYLREVGAPICRVYEHKVQSPECATCPAWWNEGRATYLSKHHPALLDVYRAKLTAVAAEIFPHYDAMQAELDGVA